jgi:DNA-binding SARP family transcriptional activator/ATP/maltotriose-dependent transcriptional regulator MalT
MSAAFSPPEPIALRPRLRVADWATAPAPDAYVLTAGPGAGKTCAAAAIAHHLGLPAVWANPTPARWPIAAGSDPVATLAAWVATHHPAGAVVVFDAVEAGADMAFLQRWLATPMPGVTTVVASREALPFSLARATAFGRVRRLGPETLFLTPEEAEAWGSATAPAHGWPLGAAALAAGAPAAMLADLAGDEWLALLPPTLASGAGRLALVESPTPEDVAALWPDAPPDALERLGDWGLLLGGTWHPLAREGLIARWARSTPIEARAADRRAAAERLAERAPDAALELLLTGGLVPEAVALVGTAGKRLAIAGAHDQLAGWLKRFGADAIAAEPVLALADGAVAQARGAYAEAEARYRQAFDAAEARGERARAFEALGDLLHLYWTREDLDSLREVAATAAAYEPDAEVGERVEYWNNLACHHFGQGEEAIAERLFRQALDFPHLGFAQVASVQQFAAMNLGILHMERGEFDEAEWAYRHVLALAAAFPLKPAVPRGATLYLAMTALRRGDRGAAAAWREALAAYPPAEEAYRRGEFAMLEGDYDLLTGDRAGAEARYREALAAFATLGMDTNADAGAATSRLAVIHRRRGELDAAIRRHAKALDLVAPWPRDRAKVLLEWATTLAAAGDLDGADAKLAEATGPWGALRAYHVECAVWLARAALAERRGRPAEAEGHLAEALALVRRGPYYYAAIAQREFAPDLWALFARTGEHELLAQIESHFPVAAANIRQELAARAPALPPQAPPAVAIRCFGELELRIADGAPSAWPRKKAKALLASLILAPEGLGREELAERLYPDLGWDEGQHQLDVAASSLRKILEPAIGRREKSRYLIVKDKRYALAREGLDLDLDAFEAAWREGQDAERGGRPDAAASAYERAIGLYRADLFSEPLLLEWFDVERHRLRVRAQAMLEHLADHAYAAGHFEPARAHWERLLALDPTHEPAHRGLMRLFARLGQPGLARAQYDLLARTLERELGESPSRDTEALLTGL